LLLGEWAGKRTLVFAGRVHYYEGHSWRHVAAPIHTAWFLGARVLLMTNAAGGIHPQLVPGRMMVIRDHIDWTNPAPWRIPGPGGSGADRTSPYSKRLMEILHQEALGLGIDVLSGKYGAVIGPCYETPAEIRALQFCGADAVGMSTACEVEAARNLGMECAGISYIANRAAGLGPGTIEHGEVLRATAAGGDALADLIERLLVRL
jgi:purine-nucleoside phosphorylase